MSLKKERPTTAAVGGAIVAGALCAGVTALPGVARAQQQAAAQSRPEEIIVTSSLVPTPRRQLGTAVSAIDGPDIELRGYDSLADVLRTQPGIGVSNSGGPGKTTAVRLRGEESYRTLLMIDGIKTLDPASPQVSPDFSTLLTAGDLERVEVLRGPQGFMYGADAGGVINVMTRRGVDGFAAGLGLEAGEFGTTKIDGSLSGGGDKGDYYLSATDFETDGFNARLADTTLRDDDGADNTTVHMKLGLNATENLRLQLVARDVDASAAYDGCFTVTFSPTNVCTNTTEQTSYRLSADHRSGDFGNSFGYSNVDIERNDYAGNALSFGAEGSISRLEYTGSYQASDATTLVYGVDLEDEEVVSDGATLDQGQDGYYAEYQGRFGDNFFLTVGARYDDNDDFGTHTSGRVSAAYTQDLGGSNSLKYRASFGNGFRAPSLFEVSYNARPFGVLPAAAARSLIEETSQGYDLGLEYDGANGLHLEVTYFDQDIEDAIVYTSDPITFDDGYVQSAGTSKSKGVELGFDVPMGDHWAFLGNWTNNDATQANGQQRARRPNDLGNLGVQYTSGDDGLRFIANYRLSKDAVEYDFFGNVFVLDDYEVLDLSVSYAFNKTFELYGRVLNATDEDYREVVGYNTSGRETYGGIRLRF
jgi:vitamin B12 transporter